MVVALGRSRWRTA